MTRSLIPLFALACFIALGCGPKQSDEPATQADNAPFDEPSTSANVDPATQSPPNQPVDAPPEDATASDQDATVKVGDTVSVELKDQSGKVRTLADLAGDGMVALVFYRSADW